MAVLLTLLSLDVKGITIGPNPPAFITPGVFKLLQEKLDLRLPGPDAKADLAWQWRKCSRQRQDFLLPSRKAGDRASVKSTTSSPVKVLMS